jgi:hypothetical protein
MLEYLDLEEVVYNGSNSAGQLPVHRFDCGTGSTVV